MYFNDVNLALGLMFAAFRGVGSAPSGYAPEVSHSWVFHPSSGAAFSTPAFSAPPSYHRALPFEAEGQDAAMKNKKAQLTQGLRATAPSFEDGRQPPSWILSNRK